MGGGKFRGFVGGGGKGKASQSKLWHWEINCSEHEKIFRYLLSNHQILLEAFYLFIPLIVVFAFVCFFLKLTRGVQLAYQLVCLFVCLLATSCHNTQNL